MNLSVFFLIHSKSEGSSSAHNKISWSKFPCPTSPCNGSPYLARNLIFCSSFINMALFSCLDFTMVVYISSSIGCMLGINFRTASLWKLLFSCFANPADASFQLLYPGSLKNASSWHFENVIFYCSIADVQ